MSISKSQILVPKTSIEEIIGLYNYGSFRETISLGEHLARQYPGSIEIYEILAAAYMNLENVDKTIELYRKVLQLTPNHIDANNNLGMVFYSQGKFN